MTCEARREQDEMFCARCNLRWDFKEDTVECGKYKADHVPDPEEVKIFRALTGRVLRNLDNHPS